MADFRWFQVVSEWFQLVEVAPCFSKYTNMAMFLGLKSWNIMMSSYRPASFVPM